MPFQPLNTGNSLKANYSQVNNMIKQLEREQTVKAFKQPGGNAIVNGRYADNKYGILLYDSDGNPSILIGQHPVDGHMIICRVKDGLNVLDELGA